MSRPPYHILREPSVAGHAGAVHPAWLFAIDGARLIFANPAGAALLGFANCHETANAAVRADIAAQVARSAATLRPGQTRLERLRGLGTGFGRPLTCTFTRIGTILGEAIVVAAIENAGPALSLGQRARYLIEGSGAAAAFGADGNLLHITTEAAEREGHITSLCDLPDHGETIHVGNGADAIVLAFIPADSEPIRFGPRDADAAASAPPELLDLSPIAEAITAMSRVPQQQNGHGKAGAPHQSDSADDQEARPERRHPLRFVWETDAENRFTIDSDEFIALAGTRTANLLGRFWGEISAKLALDPEGRIAHALVSRRTWSGIEVDWPTASGERARVTLSAIPIFDSDRIFRGYRGLGVLHRTAAVAGEIATAAPKTEPAVEITPAIPMETAPAISVETAPAVQVETTTQIEAAPTAPVDELTSQAEVSAPPDEAPAAQAESEAAPPPENVVLFPAANLEAKPAALNAAERRAFRDIASRLSARLKGADELARGLMEKAVPDDEPPYIPATVPLAAPQVQASVQAQAVPEILPTDDEGSLASQRPVLDRLPHGVLIYRGTSFLYANPAFLQLAGHASLSEFAEAGGLDSMPVEFDGPADDEAGQRLRITADSGVSMEGRLFTAQVDGDNAMVLMLQPAIAAPAQIPQASATDIDHLAALIDIAADGMVTVDRNAIIVDTNARADRLFGYDACALVGRRFSDLFAPEGERSATSRLERLIRGEATTDDDAREIVGRRRQGTQLSLQLTLGRANAEGTRFYALFRDLTRWKDAEKEMSAARRQAEKASAAKSEFLAKISHEMRTPLNAIIGFSEVMMEERFGPVGNERYRDYLKDINTSGAHLVALLNDLLDLSKIEAGKMELSFERVDLNEITQQSVAIMQAQANRARVIMRTALSMNIPNIIADARSVRQIVLNLLSNSIKFTGAGGQVIVSTAAAERGDVVLRVRDTGIGMSERDIETALQPFRQLATSGRTDVNGTGLGLPLTKALVEANRARFSIKSAVNAGTLVEIVFPAGRD